MGPCWAGTSQPWESHPCFQWLIAQPGARHSPPALQDRHTWGCKGAPQSAASLATPHPQLRPHTWSLRLSPSGPAVLGLHPSQECGNQVCNAGRTRSCHPADAAGWLTGCTSTACGWGACWGAVLAAGHSPPFMPFSHSLSSRHPLGIIHSWFFHLHTHL